jgi:hypothetical protein
MAAWHRASPALALLGLAVTVVRGHALAQSPEPPWISNQEQATLAAGLQSKLPNGWTLTARGLGTIPVDWQSEDHRTFQIDGNNGEQSFRIWYLPTDWIGIRRPDASRTITVYWEGILANSKYKSITTGDATIHNAVHATGMSTPSLANGGWLDVPRVFGNRPRLEEVDEQTQALVKRHCTTRECVDEAAFSLIMLGVPARSLTRDCVQHASGRAQELCASVLGYWGDADDVPLLNTLVAQPAISAAVRQSAAFSLLNLADPSSGPALRQALQATAPANHLSMTIIVRTLGRIRHTAAGPDLVSRLIAERNSYMQRELAKALADVRYLPSTPAIRQVCRTSDVSSEWIALNTAQGNQDSLPEMALLRLTASWGPPSDRVRILVLPPVWRAVPGKIEVAAVIENVGDRDLESLRMTPGVWIVDGREYPAIDRPKYDGNMNVPVNGLDVRIVDLSPAIATPGAHTFSYRLLGATSNPVTQTFR